MELREPEAFGVLDDHAGRVRHVDADLDDRRRDQHIDVPFSEASHGLFLLGGLHLAVQKPDTEFLEDLGLEERRFGLRRTHVVLGEVVEGIDEGFPIRLIVARTRMRSLVSRRLRADERADDERLPSLRACCSHGIVGAAPLSKTEDVRRTARPVFRHILQV